MDTKKPDDLFLCQALHDSTQTLLTEALDCTELEDAHSIESVHRQRVIMKHLRSYQQLIRTLVPERSLNFANQRVKKVNSLLSDRRDHDVLMKTHRKLFKKAKGKKTIKSLRALEKWLDELQAEEPLRIAWSKVRNPIRVEITFWKRQLEKWPSTADENLIEGLVATYNKARTRFKSAYGDKDRKRYHDWRKWTKYLLYQLEFFSEHGNVKNRKHIDALTKLGKLLGNHQDLQIYRKHIHQVSAHDFSSDQLARCDVLIRQKEKALEAQSKKIGDQWFKEKPTQFEKRMRGKYLLKRQAPDSDLSPDS
jgi:CHAD domain-containing protein